MDSKYNEVAGTSSLVMQLSRAAVIIGNMLMLLIGLGVVAFGAVLLTLPQIWAEIAQHGLKYVSPKSGYVSEEEILSVAPYIQSLTVSFSIGMLVVGALLSLLFAFGLIVSYFMKPKVLMVYIVVLGIFIGIHVMGVVVYAAARHSFDKSNERALQKMMYKFKSESSKKPLDIFLGLVMRGFQCCGFKDGEDFRKSKAFSREVEVDEKQFKNTKYPPSCCKHIDVSKSSDCPATFNSRNSNIEHGCSSVVSNLVEHLLSPVIYGSLIIPAVEIFLLVVAVLVVKHLEKSVEQPAVWNRTYN